MRLRDLMFLIKRRRNLLAVRHRVRAAEKLRLQILYRRVLIAAPVLGIVVIIRCCLAPRLITEVAVLHQKKTLRAAMCRHLVQNRSLRLVWNNRRLSVVLVLPRVYLMVNEKFVGLTALKSRLVNRLFRAFIM